MVDFGNLDSEGKYTFIRRIPQADILKCPHAILVPEHFRQDNTCRCNDPAHNMMADWGYVWDPAASKWIAPHDSEEYKDYYKGESK